MGILDSKVSIIACTIIFEFAGLKAAFSQSAAAYDMAGQYICNISRAAGIYGKKGEAEYAGIFNIDEATKSFSITIDRNLRDDISRQACWSLLFRSADIIKADKQSGDIDAVKGAARECLAEYELIMIRGGNENKYLSYQASSNGIAFQGLLPGIYFIVFPNSSFIMGDLTSDTTANTGQIEDGTCVKLTKRH